MSRKVLVSCCVSILVLCSVTLLVFSLTGCGQQEKLVQSVSNLDKSTQDETEGKEDTSEDETGKDVTENTNEKVVFISTSKLNVRADSNRQSEVLGSLAKGKEVKVIEEVKNGETIWYKIQFKNSKNNNEGWILSQYTVKNINELFTSPTLFDDKDINDYFTSPTLFDDNTIIAYYGNPNSKIMGIVGRHSKEEIISMVKKTSKKYDSQNGNKGVIPAIYLVYGTAQPGGEIGTINFDLVMSYIESAYKNGVLIYLDHQIGKYSPIDAMNELLPFLKYPNVHLALDPEWRTDRPMKEVGHLTAVELNEIQKTMREYIISKEIRGKRQLVFHQFLDKMVRDIKEVSSNYDPVLLVHNTSGWGPPSLKIATHTRNAKAENIPYKGFKLWYFYSNSPGVHFDNPIMTPEQVLNLNPKPELIIYQ